MTSDPHPSPLWPAGSFLRAAREARQLTQEQVAGLAGCDRSTLARLENGGARPSLSTLAALCDALGIGQRDRGRFLC
jgi:transcriptional regulator with XRE-family HTH domain